MRVSKKDPKKKVTKESVFLETKERFKKEFPNESIDDSTLRGYSMVYLLSGMRPEQLTKQVEIHRKKAKG